MASNLGGLMEILLARTWQSGQSDIGVPDGKSLGTNKHANSIHSHPCSLNCVVE